MFSFYHSKRTSVSNQAHVIEDGIQDVLLSLCSLLSELSELSVLCCVLVFGLVAVNTSNVSALFPSCGAVR